jgi:outer membrane protein assembly factor BamD (BamD/ComL family)
LSRAYQNTDGGMQALYELTLLNIRVCQEEPKKENLVQAINMLTSFLSLYPNSFYAAQVRKNLLSLPKLE